MKKISIYLAGKIQKGHQEPNKYYWQDEEIGALEKALKPYEVFFLNPAVRTDDLERQKSVFGRDMAQVYASDVVFVDVRDRRGLGVGAEMMWAKMNQIPVVTWSPRNTHYQKPRTELLGVEIDNWIHPFVESLSDIVVETLEEGAAWIKSSHKEVKGPDFIYDAMKSYLHEQFAKDEPMRELARENPDIKKVLSGLLAAAPVAAM